MRHLSLLLLLIIAINAQCQQIARYEIFKTIGPVLNASTGQVVKEGATVDPKDKLIIKKDSKAAILDRQQHRIYYSQKSGTQSVASIMHDARRKADNVVAAINSEVLNQSKQVSNRPKVKGASYRGSEAENALLQSVCNAIFDITRAQPENRLSLTTVDNDGTFYFSIKNDTDSLLYVNIIAVRPEETPQLCLNIGITDNQPYVSIAPNSELKLSEFVFVDCVPTDYYMFASYEPIDSQALSLLLNVGERIYGVENAPIIVSPKITRQSDE